MNSRGREKKATIICFLVGATEWVLLPRSLSLSLFFLFSFGHTTQHRIWDLSSVTRDQVHIPSSLHWKCDVLTTVLPGKFLLPVSNVTVESS